MSVMVCRVRLLAVWMWDGGVTATGVWSCVFGVPKNTFNTLSVERFINGLVASCLFCWYIGDIDDFTLMRVVGRLVYWRFALFYTYRIINYHVESIQDNCICLPHKFKMKIPMIKVTNLPPSSFEARI